MPQVLGNFIIVGIKNLLIKDRLTKEIVGDIDKIVDINITDEMAVEFLRGGFSNPKLLTIYGDRDTKFTANNATLTPELMKIMMNTSQEEGVEEMSIEPESFMLNATVHTATLADTPKDVNRVEVYVLDITGKKAQKLKLTTTDVPAEGEFAVSGKELTFDDGLEGKVKVYYTVAKPNAIKFEVKDITPIAYDMAGVIVVKEVESGRAYAGEIHIPNGSIQPSYNLAGKNEATVPDAIALTIDMLTDDYVGYPYRIVIDKTEK